MLGAVLGRCQRWRISQLLATRIEYVSKGHTTSYHPGVENASHYSNGARDVAAIVTAGGLVDATPDAIRKLAGSAMLLSQGARRAIEMKREAENGSAARPASAGAAADKAPPA